MPGKLGLQPTLEAGLDQLLDQPITAFGLHLPSIDLRVQIIEHTRRLQRSNALTLLTTPPLTLLLINHDHQYLLFNQKHHRLHKQSDTLMWSSPPCAWHTPSVVVCWRTRSSSTLCAATSTRQHSWPIPRSPSNLLLCMFQYQTHHPILQHIVWGFGITPSY